MTELSLHPYPTYKPSGVPWLGDVPEHWEVRRLKSVCRLTYGDTLPADLRSNGVVPVYGSNGAVGVHSSANSRGPCIVVGRKGSFGKVHFSEQPVFAIDTTYFVDDRHTKENIRWLSYVLGWLRLDAVTKDSAIPGLGRDDAYQSILPLPPLVEQRGIVRYLEHVDGRIRRYVEAKEKLVGLLEEEKQAVVNRAVTRGIDPNVRLKPSGVDWLDDVPEHWEVRRSKRLFSPRKELARPNDIQLSATQAYGVIPQDEYERRVGRRIVKISLHLEKRRHVEVDDFVISMRSFQGGLERAWATGCIRSSYIVLRPTAEADVGFFSYVFKSQAYIMALQSTANFIRDGQDLNFDNFCAVDLPLPPEVEQRSIAAAVREATASLDSAIGRARRQIELLQEYRTRLIADVVTGKLDVREAASQLPEESASEVAMDTNRLMAENGDAGFKPAFT